MRAGTKVLLDPLDYKDFSDLLAGKDLDSKSASANGKNQYLLPDECYVTAQFLII